MLAYWLAPMVVGETCAQFVAFDAPPKVNGRVTAPVTGSLNVTLALIVCVDAYDPAVVVNATADNVGAVLSTVNVGAYVPLLVPPTLVTAFTFNVGVNAPSLKPSNIKLGIATASNGRYTGNAAL